MEKAFDQSAIKKLKLLVTVVDRPKGEFYLDVLSQFEINLQMVVGGIGTAKSEFIEMLGLNMHKAVIFSIIREDMTGRIMDCLDTKFRTIKNGKGIAFAVPLSSVIGVSMYQFLSNSKLQKGD